MNELIEEVTQYPIEDLELYSVANEKGKIFYPDNVFNISQILKNHPMFKGKLRKNDWKNKKEIEINGKWVDIEDYHYIKILNEVSQLYPHFCRVSEKTVKSAVICVCNDNVFDSAVSFLRNLPKWDNQPRLEMWLWSVYGCEDDAEYYNAVGSNFFKGMVARILRPGVKFDTVMILFGQQGYFKSTSLRIIAGDWHTETSLSVKNKDFFLILQGNLIVEFSEGATISRSDTKTLKSILSVNYDEFRPPYGYENVKINRRCVFAMTTNDDEFLKDETGNRRFLPVQVKKKADIQWLKDNLKQMYAEALYRYEVLHETIWEYPENAQEHQDNRMITSGYEEKIEKFIKNPIALSGLVDLSNGFTLLELYDYIFPGDRDFNKKKYDLIKVLKKNNYEVRRVYVGNVRGNFWFKK